MKKTIFIAVIVLLFFGVWLYFFLTSPAPVKANFQGGELGDTRTTTKFEILPTTCFCPEGNCACVCYCLYEGYDRICNCTIMETKKTETNKPTQAETENEKQKKGNYNYNCLCEGEGGGLEVGM